MRTRLLSRLNGMGTCARYSLGIHTIQNKTCLAIRTSRIQVTVIACVELPRRERHVADLPDRGILITRDNVARHWITSLTMEEARLQGKLLPIGTEGVLRLRDIGDVPIYVIAQTVDGLRVRLKPIPDQREALMLRFYAEGAAPGIARARMSGLLMGLGRRLSFNARR
jgi:cellulose synthase (UDP-forming)